MYMVRGVVISCNANISTWLEAACKSNCAAMQIHHLNLISTLNFKCVIASCMWMLASASYAIHAPRSISRSAMASLAIASCLRPDETVESRLSTAARGGNRALPQSAATGREANLARAPPRTVSNPAARRVPRPPWQRRRPTPHSVRWISGEPTPGRPRSRKDTRGRPMTSGPDRAPLHFYWSS
jgi:hypothetical protein